MSPEVRAAIEKADMREKFETDPEFHRLIRTIDAVVTASGPVLQEQLQLTSAQTREIQRELLEALVTGQSKRERIREQVLQAFDVTDADLAPLDALMGRAEIAASMEREAFLGYADRTQRRFLADLGIAEV